MLISLSYLASTCIHVHNGHKHVQVYLCRGESETARRTSRNLLQQSMGQCVTMAEMKWILSVLMQLGYMDIQVRVYKHTNQG